MLRSRCLLFVVLLSSLGACTKVSTPKAPSKPDAEPAATETAQGRGLGEICRDDDPCAPGLTCVTPCGDSLNMPYEPDECEPASLSFCDAEPGSRTLGPDELMLVLSAGGLHAVLEQPESPTVLVEGEVRALAKNDEAIVAGRPAPADLVPEHARALVGRRFTVMGATGPVCEAELTGFAVIGLEPRNASPEEVRDRVEVGDLLDEHVLYYAIQNAAVFVTAELRPEGACAGAMWARASDLPPVTTVAGLAPCKDERDAVLATFADLGVTRVHADRLQRSTEDPTAQPWTAHDVRVSAFELDGDRHLVAGAEVPGICGEFAAALMVSFSADDLTRPEALSWTEVVKPAAAFDLDGDGRLELIGHAGTGAELWSTTLRAPSSFWVASPSSGC